jgi:oligopeptide transport system substrate-binding protein
MPRLLRFLPTLIGALLLVACTGRESAVESGTRQQILHRGIGVEPSDLDPQIATATNDFHTISALFEGLVGQDPTNLSPVPGVAERWETSGDARTYTFFLRANARWSNGDPVTAQDFVASYKRMLTAALAADNANLLYVLQGAEAYHKGGSKDFASVGVTAVDARTLRLTLEHPTPYFLSLLQHWAWFPVHLPTIEKSGDPAVRGNPWAKAGTLVGNGPFLLTEWSPNQRIVVTKSPTYWDAATVRLQAIHLYPIDSRDAEERAFRAGQLHVTEALPTGKVETYKRDQPDVLRIDPYLGTEFYRINVTRPFLNEKRVRRALALAVDRRAIVERILQGGQEPAIAFTPPGTAGYSSAAILPTDIAEAKRLLAEAGYPGGVGAPAIELAFNTSETHRLVAEAVQEMWRRDLGLDVRLVNQELRSVLAARRTGDFQVLRSVWIGDFTDPATFLNIWRSDSGNNYTGWASSTYDQLTFQAARTSDPAARHALFARAEALLLDEAPLIPIYHYTHVFLVHPSVKGWHPTLLDHHPYKHVWLEP